MPRTFSMKAATTDGCRRASAEHRSF